MIVNAGKFEGTFVKRNPYMIYQYTLNIHGNQVTSSKSVKLLRITVDNKLSFGEQISVCKKASNQLNTISRLHKCLRF